MKNLGTTSHMRELEMATEDHYRKQALFYKRSDEYIRMVDLYPILQTTINDCRNEELVN